MSLGELIFVYQFIKLAIEAFFLRVFNCEKSSKFKVFGWYEKI